MLADGSVAALPDAAPPDGQQSVEQRHPGGHRFQANQLRLLLAALAYTLMINLRRLGLQGTELAQACTATIRTKLLKIGAVLIRNTRRVRFLLAASYPHQELFATVVARLASG